MKSNALGLLMAVGCLACASTANAQWTSSNFPGPYPITVTGTPFQSINLGAEAAPAATYARATISATWTYGGSGSQFQSDSRASLTNAAVSSGTTIPGTTTVYYGGTGGTAPTNTSGTTTSGVMSWQNRTLSPTFAQDGTKPMFLAFRTSFSSGAAPTWSNITVSLGFAPVAPPNQSCATATDITAAASAALTGPNTIYNTTARDITLATSTTVTMCNAASGTRPLFYRWTPTTTTGYTIARGGSDNITAGETIQILDVTGQADPCSPAGTQVLCGTLPQTVSLIAGRTYTLVQTRTGTTTLGATENTYQLAITQLPPPPSNDDCVGAIAIDPSVTSYLSTPVDVTGATKSVAEPTTCSTNMGFSIWYSFAPLNTGDYTFSTCAADAAGCTISDTVMAVYSGSCGTFAAVGCNDDSTSSALGACATGSTSRSRFRVRLNAGTTYFVHVAKFGTTAPTVGANALQFAMVNFAPPPVPPANSSCATAIDISSAANPAVASSFAYSAAAINMTGAPTTPLTLCSGTGTATVFYKWTPDATASYTLARGASDNITAGETVQVLDVTGLPDPCVGGTQVACGALPQTLTLNAGSTYVITQSRTGTTALGGTETSYQLRVSKPIPAATNDECATAVVIPGSSTSYTSPPVNIFATTRNAVTEPTPSCQSSVQNTIWYSFNPTTSGDYTFSNCPTDAPLSTPTDTVLTVHTGTCGGPYTQVGCNDDAGIACTGNRSSVRVRMFAGTQYYIMLAKFSTAAVSTDAMQIAMKDFTALPPNPVMSACTATPSSAAQGATTIISSNVVAGAGATISTVTADLSAFGLGNNVALSNGGSGNVYTYSLSIPVAQPLGASNVTITATDSNTLQSTCVANLTIVLPPPANDECSGALVIAPFTTTYLSTPVAVANATRSVAEPAFSCQTSVASTIWYSLTPTTSGNYVFSTCALDAPATQFNDTVLAVYTGTCGSFTQVDCNDDSGDGNVASCTTGSTLRSKISIGLTAGTPYYILVGKYSTVAVAGSDLLQFAITAPLPPPANAVCSGAVDISTAANAALTTLGTSYSAAAINISGMDATTSTLCDASTGTRTIYYLFTPSASGQYVFARGTSDNVSAGQVFSITDVTGLGNPCVGGTSIACASTTAAPTLTAGNTYLITQSRAGTTALAGGENTYQLKVTRVEPVVCGTNTEAEPNDSKAAANAFTLVSGDTICGSTTGSATTGGADSIDYFKITVAQHSGVKLNRLRVVTLTAGHSLALRGLNQSAGVIGTTDTSFATSSSTTNPASYVQWYTSGDSADANARSVYVAISGSATTTSQYSLVFTQVDVDTTATLSRDLVPGSITIDTLDGAADTDLWVYDSSFNPVAGFGNDNFSSAAVTRTVTAGTYYVAVGLYNTANNLQSPSDDEYLSGNVMDFAGVTASSSTSSITNEPIAFTDGTGIVSTTFSVARNEIAWIKFVAAAPSLGCSPADIAYGDGEPLPPIGQPGGFNPEGPDGGDFDCFFNFYFAAAPDNAVCDIAYGDGEPLPPYGVPGGFNPGVDGGDFDCFFNYYFSGCL